MPDKESTANNLAQGDQAERSEDRGIAALAPGAQPIDRLHRWRAPSVQLEPTAPAQQKRTGMPLSDGSSRPGCRIRPAHGSDRSAPGRRAAAGASVCKALQTSALSFLG